MAPPNAVSTLGMYMETMEAAEVAALTHEGPGGRGRGGSGRQDHCRAGAGTSPAYKLATTYARTSCFRAHMRDPLKPAS